MRKGWLPTALAVFAMAGAARADAPSVGPVDSVIVIIGEATTAEPAVVTSLPAMIIEGDRPRRAAVAIGGSPSSNAFGSFVIDPETGLAVPRRPHDARVPIVAGAARGPTPGTQHIDRETGLMVPDFVDAASVTASSSRTYVVDRSTGLIVPNFRGRGRVAPHATSSGMTIDPSTGLMIPAAFATPRRGRAP